MSSSATASSGPLPRDARLIALILSSLGAQEVEEGVLRMLVEFAHRYTTDVLTDAMFYAEHARSGSGSAAAVIPGMDDVRLAIQARTEGGALPKEFLLNLASTVNAAPLPPVPEVYGVRLPPQSARLTAPNFSLAPKSAAPPPPVSAAAVAMASQLSGAGAGGGAATSEGDASEDGDAGGLFGDEDEDEDEEEDEGEENEEMEDVSFVAEGVNGSGGGDGGGDSKRKAEESDEEYD